MNMLCRLNHVHNALNFACKIQTGRVTYLNLQCLFGSLYIQYYRRGSCSFGSLVLCNTKLVQASTHVGFKRTKLVQLEISVIEN